MNYFLHIKPQFDCIMHACKDEWTLHRDQIKNFLLRTDEENITLFFYPISNNKCGSETLPFSVKYNTKKQSTSSPNAEVTLFPQNNILLTIKPFVLKYPKFLALKSKTIAFASTNHTIYYSKYSPFAIHIENDENKHIDIEFDKKIEDISFKTCQNNLFIYAKTLDNKYVVCLLSYWQEYNIQTLEEVDLLEIEDDKLLTYRDLQDSAKHGETIEYSFGEKLSVRKDIVYDQGQAIVEKQKELIPKAFLQAIKVHDLKLARSYLTSNLSQTLDDKHLVAYFGKFVDIEMSLSNNPQEIALIYQDGDIRQAKVFSFTFSDDKISNITE